MTLGVTHAKVSAIPDAGDASLVEPSDWNAGHVITMATGKLLGRSTAGTGTVEEISVGSGLLLSGGTLSSTDVGGTVTSVSVSLATTGTDLSFSVSNPTTTPAIALSVPTASAATRGALSSTDWSTFNGKQAAITFGTGTLTALGVNVGSAGAIVVNGGALGTPSTGTLTNCSGLPVSGITSSTSTALGVGSLELGSASDTTLSRSSAGVLAVEGVVIPSVSSANTLTNKRVTPRMNSQTTTASPWAWNSDSYDEQAFTALANALTINADAGTPTDGQRTILRFLDNGTGRALTWTTGSSGAFRAVGITLPTTTTANKTTYVGCIYNATAARWDAIATVTEA